MTKAHLFTKDAIAARRASEPNFRNFPSLHSTIVSTEKNLIAYPEGSKELADFFATQQLQDFYPFVWVRNAVDVRGDGKGGEKCTFVQEIMISYDVADVPATAPLLYSHGELTLKNPRAQPLMIGETPRMTDGFRDILNTFPRCVVGPSKPLPQPVEQIEDEQEVDAPRM